MDLIGLAYDIKANNKINNDAYIQLLGLCIAFGGQSQSQNFQDIWALYRSGFKKSGSFVEFGGTDGIDCSNTYLLAKNYGWYGIVAEPNPVWHERLIMNRKESAISTKCVHTETGKTVDFLAVEGTEAGLSTIKGFGDDDEHREKRKNSSVISVETITLFDLLEEYRFTPHIDYISVDTEGSEYEILSKFFEQNHDQYNVKLFTVEHNYNLSLRDKIHDLMMANGYQREFVELSRWDDFYRKVS